MIIQIGEEEDEEEAESQEGELMDENRSEQLSRGEIQPAHAEVHQERIIVLPAWIWHADGGMLMNYR